MADAAALEQPATLIEMTADLIAAYVSKNHVRAAELPELIATVHASLAGLGQAPAPETAAAGLKPAVSIRTSVTDELITSLEDGRKFKSMKRYLSGLGMTPADYRTKWGLSADYPMVAPAYAKARSDLARSHSFGRKSAEDALPEPDEVLRPPIVPEMRKLKHPTR